MSEAPPEAPVPQPTAEPRSRRALVTLWARRAEDGISTAALLLLAVLPVLEMLLRGLFKIGIPGSVVYVQHLTLYVGFLGALIAAREGKHLNLGTVVDKLPPRGKAVAQALAAIVSVAVAAALAHASWEFVKAEMEAPVKLAGWLPVWVAELILPVSFAGIALRFAWNAGGWIARGVALLGVLAAWVVGFPLAPHAPSLLWPLVGVVLLAVVFGAPLFVGMGGAALLLWLADDVPVAAIPVETYRLVTSPSIAMVPLFTVVGFLLAEGKS
ncbi:MAG TPA: TRAP transporter small permease, partial [Planctomycetota bacterium]|nr:TRAP transporter small permease [Planctomycetota bacterium]